MSDPEHSGDEGNDARASGEDEEYYEEGDVSDEEGEGSGPMEGLDPDHPLLARAQAALKKQLLDARQDLEERIREKTEELNVRRGVRARPLV